MTGYDRFVGHQSLYKRRAKDTVMNCIETNEFVWNMPTYDQRLDVNASALETWDDEFEISNIKKAPSNLVRPPLEWQIARLLSNVEFSRLFGFRMSITEMECLGRIWLEQVTL